MDQKPTPEIVAQAHTQPNSWIYKLDGEFGPDDAVPREVIIGAWQVDSAGNITGSFIRNPNHRHAPRETAEVDPPTQLPWQIMNSLRCT